MNFLVVLGRIQKQTPQKPLPSRDWGSPSNFVKPDMTRFPYVTKLLRLCQTLRAISVIRLQGEDLCVSSISMR